jgi:tetratricopeptide (TPR) repeat protein
VNAEQAYVFRHALVREGAYQLLPPEQRAQMHALAMDALEHLFEPGARDPLALELADHAALAQQGRHTGNIAKLRALAEREVHYLRRAAEYAQANYHMDEAIRQWDRLANHSAQSEAERLLCLNSGATARFHSGRLQEAEGVLRAGIERAGDSPIVTQLRLGLSAALYNMARVEEAVVQLELARQGLESAPASDALARALGNLGACMVLLDRLPEAEQHYQRALELADRLGNRALQYQLIGNLGNLRHRQGRWQEGERDYLRSLELAKQAGDLRSVAANCVSVGIGYCENGDLARAIDYMQRSVAISRACQDRYRLGDALGTLATLDARPDNIEVTRQRHEEALEIHRETGHAWGEATALMGLSDMYVYERDYQRAREALDRARKMAAGLHDLEREGVAVLRLALIEMSEGDRAGAEATWHRGRAMLKGLPMHDTAMQSEMLALCAKLGVPPLEDAP